MNKKLYIDNHRQVDLGGSIQSRTRNTAFSGLQCHVESNYINRSTPCSSKCPKYPGRTRRVCDIYIYEFTRCCSVTRPTAASPPCFLKGYGWLGDSAATRTRLLPTLHVVLEKSVPPIARPTQQSNSKPI